MGLGDFFKKLGASIEVNIVVEAYEADLYAPDGDRSSGKLAELEFCRFKTGECKFEIEIKRRAGIPEGDEAAVLIHGVEVARVTILKLQTEVKLYTKNSDDIPPIKLGDKAEITHNGIVIATGVFRPD